MCRQDGACPYCNAELAAIARAAAANEHVLALTLTRQRDERLQRGKFGYSFSHIRAAAHPPQKTAPEPPSLVAAIQDKHGYVPLVTPQATGNAPPPPSLIDAIRARRDR